MRRRSAGLSRDAVLAAASAVSGISREDLLMRTRRHDIARPRAAIWHALKLIYGESVSYPTIAEWWAGRDWSTIVKGVQWVASSGHTMSPTALAELCVHLGARPSPPAELRPGESWLHRRRLEWVAAEG